MSIISELIEDITEGGMRRHRVEFPENLSVISRHYYGCKCYALTIFAANRDVLSDPNYLPAGTVLMIPHVTNRCRQHA